MDILSAEFLKGSSKPEHFPDSKLPEVAFIGRSNVGKSSLLNNLVRRKNLARISNTPGKTQEINFFLVNNQWMLTDMPGYGYAKRGKSERDKWAVLNEQYLLHRIPLHLTCLLVDSRHDPENSDLAMMEWLQNHERSFIIILTKTDKISTTIVQERKEQISKIVQFCDLCVEVLPHSSKTSSGRENLWAIIKRELLIST